ncbi:hypothetical protein HDU88_005512 [Geranomyces variabilis]|nr:hypothetical protein HDU88_005512 [Geranomyces variabilis]
MRLSSRIVETIGLRVIDFVSFIIQQQLPQPQLPVPATENDGTDIFDEPPVGWAVPVSKVPATDDPHHLAYYRIVNLGTPYARDPIKGVLDEAQWIELINAFITRDEEADDTPLAQLWCQHGRPLSNHYAAACGSMLTKQFRMVLSSNDGPDGCKVFSDAGSDASNEVRTYVQAAWKALERAIRKQLLVLAAISETIYRSDLLDILFAQMFDEEAEEALTYTKGETGNECRRLQNEAFLEPNEMRGAGGWKHDGVVDIHQDGKRFHVFFFEAVGGPAYRDDAKCVRDTAKTFKAMRLAIQTMQKHLLSLGASEETLKRCEAHGCVVHETTMRGYTMYAARDGLFVADKVWEMDLPKRASDFAGVGPRDREVPAPQRQVAHCWCAAIFCCRMQQGARGGGGDGRSRSQAANGVGGDDPSTQPKQKAPKELDSYLWRLASARL